MSSSGQSPRRLDGKVAIVTGGASGIGEETVRRFVEKGAFVVIGDVQVEKGEAISSSLGTGCAAFIRCDVTDEEQVKSMVEWTVRTRGRLDVMFSNAGISGFSDQTVVDFDVQGFERLFAVNVRGMALCVKHAARAMIDSGAGGSIICTASVAASRGHEKHTDYTMSKHAVLGLMRSASKQLGGYGIRVNSVSPGPIPTPLLCDMLGVGEKETERFLKGITSLKGKLEVEHVAEAVVFLASEEAQFICGHDLVVDGGSVAQIKKGGE